MLQTPPTNPKHRERAAAMQALMINALRHYEAGRMAEAEKLCLQILAIDVRQPDALYVLGMTAYKTDRFELAERMIRRAIAIDPSQPFYQSNLGNTLKALKRNDEAIAHFKKAIELKPEFDEAYFNLGNIYLEQKKNDEAEACYRRAVALKPTYADAWCNLGNLLRIQKRLEEAVDSFQHALDLNPDHPDYCCCLGDSLHAQGKLLEAVALYEKTISIKPDHFKASNCLCNANFDLGKLANSIAWCKRTLALKPDYGDAQMNFSLLQLLEGNYRDGWRNYEIRWKVYPPRVFSQPLWDGRPLNGARILIHGEQGLGDSLQFLRYVPMVQAAGGSVVLDLPANLRRLAQLLPGLAALVNTGDPLPPFDYYAPLMSLPLAFGTTVETIPAKVPYLVAPEAALQKARALAWPATGLRVGIAWTGNPGHPKNRSRSIPLPMLEPLFRIEGARFFSLQIGPTVADLNKLPTNLPNKIGDLAPVTGDMADTAAQIECMDLIISIDTSMAHLAGALGKPLWVLLSLLPDWRWLIEREDCPWYPTARLFRQTTLNDWTPVVEKLRAALVELVAQKRALIA